MSDKGQLVRAGLLVGGMALATAAAMGVCVAVMPDAKPTLERIAIYRPGAGLRVCPSTDLHDCRIRMGTAMGRDRLLTAPLIAAQAECDGQESRVREACGRTAPVTDYGDAEQARRHNDCLVAGGVVEASATALTDPRDPHLDARAFEMGCREGVKTGSFQEEGL